MVGQSKDYMTIAWELAIQATGHKFPRLSQVGEGWVHAADGPRTSALERPEIPSYALPVESDRYAIFLLDTLLGRDGNLYLIEANGSNAALSSAGGGLDSKRALHMFATFKSKQWRGVPSVALLAHPYRLLHLVEFFQRAGLFAELLANDFDVRLAGTSEQLGGEDLAVVCGEIGAIADQVSTDGERLYYRGRPVAFASNANLLPELDRRGVLSVASPAYDRVIPIFHEGAAVPITHDKGLQQTLCARTGFRPLQFVAADDFDAAVDALMSLLSQGKVAIGKINSGSGGAGIEVFAPHFSHDEILRRLDSMIESSVAKYGDAAESTIYPLRFFEFATSTPYVLRDGPRLWDFRFQCLVYPGYVDVTPCVIRLCPDVFDAENYERGGVVANLSGRPPSLRFMRAPFARRKSDPEVTVLDEIGLSQQRLFQLVESCARWCEGAMNWVATKTT